MSRTKKEDKLTLKRRDLVIEGLGWGGLDGRGSLVVR